MASYELVFKKSVAKDLSAFPRQDVKRIMQRIRSLAADPRPVGCEKLSGQERYCRCGHPGARRRGDTGAPSV
jgi:mRNA interferase RelE/StbE